MQEPKPVSPKAYPRSKVMISCEYTVATSGEMPSTSDVAPLVRESIMNKNREYVFSLCLDGANRIVTSGAFQVGTTMEMVFHPRKVFNWAMNGSHTVVGTIWVQYRPGNILVPSVADRIRIKRCRDAGDLLGIALLDYVVVSETDYYSCKEWEGDGWPDPDLQK